MADKAKKISELVSLTSTTVAANDHLVIVDTSASETKKITAGALQQFFNDQPSHLTIQRVITGGTATVNTYIKVILCNPSAAGNNINIQLPVTSINDGKDFYVKNINTGSYSVTVTCGASQLENFSGSLVNSVNLGSTGHFGHWVWDDSASAYRLIGGFATDY